MVKRKSHPFYFSAKLQSINDKTCRFILKDAIFFKKVGNHGEKNFYGCVLMCLRLRSAYCLVDLVAMICLKWNLIDVRFGSAQRTVAGFIYNDLFKME
ncbi:hypothetical protein SAMN05421785_1014 [Chryseobacterium gambrini]|uniref:Uncharacterized protein n=1 Tax=Chryseobacterium gambrini TaxID=373672 RepID=A0A1N7JMZ1_9FLAO|nr:hypothetical protein SAMN05421785_1014 [Chryseobacterium gambrini]